MYITEPWNAVTAFLPPINRVTDKGSATRSLVLCARKKSRENWRFF